MIQKLKNIRTIIRKNSRYNISYSVFLLSLFGSFFNVGVFYFIIPSLSLKISSFLVLGAVSWMIPVAYFVYIKREEDITIAINSIKNGVDLDPLILRNAKKKLTTRPKFSAFLIFSFWFISAFQNSAIAYFFDFTGQRDAIYLFIGIGFMGNPIISIITYFLVEIMSRNDMRVLEIDIELESPKFSIRYKILFTMIFLSSLFIFLLTSIALENMREMSPNVGQGIHSRHILQTIAISFMAIFYIIVAAYFISKSITDPIKELNKAMKKVAIGEIETKAHIISSDEVGSLAKGFNLMTSGLRDRENIKRIFGHYVSTEIRDEILSGSFELGGQNVEATVLFADIRDFTTLSENNKPEKILAILNSYFTEMVEAITQNGGIVDKFIGDAIMAYFGPPKYEGNHAEQALAAAKEMLSRLDSYNLMQESKGLPKINIGIGINTGELIMGNIGSENRREFTIIGDTVNTASRIEGITKIYHKNILYSEATFKLLGSGIYLGEVDLKGKQRKVKIYSTA